MNGIPFYRNRLEAGGHLARVLEPKKGHLVNPIVLGIPRGGLFVGAPVAEMLHCGLEAVMVRKLPIPDNREAGFGAVNIDGGAVLNEEIVRWAGVSPEDIEREKKEVLQELKRREKVYGVEMPSLSNRDVIIADDGLATGYSMVAAVDFAEKQNPLNIIVAVPVASNSAPGLIKSKGVELVCPYVSEALSFAVASFYDDFHEIDDEEVIALLRKFRGGGK